MPLAKFAWKRWREGRNCGKSGQLILEENRTGHLRRAVLRFYGLFCIPWFFHLVRHALNACAARSKFLFWPRTLEKGKFSP